MLSKKSVATKKIFTFALFIYSLSVFVFMAFITKPIIEGDGFEYVYMAESFVQHKTPDLQENDIKIAQKHLSEQNPHISIRPNAYSGYYEGNNGKYYCYHFWLYSLIVSPVQKILHALHLNELKSFVITNTFLYLLMLWFIYLYGREKKRLILTVLMAASPLIPYIIWPHTEVFSAALVTVALVCYYNKNIQPAILFSAIAACQNPPIGFLTIYFGCVYLYNVFQKYRREYCIDLRDFIIAGLCGLPLIFSPLFYYIYFSTFNLIQKAGAARFDEISFHKFFSYFFDLNQGAIVYSGLLMVVFLWCLIRNIWLRNFKNFELVVCLILMTVLSLTTPVWNCGMSVVLRYFVWMYPLIVFYVAYSINFDNNKCLGFLLFVNMLALCVAYNGFSGKDDHVWHKYVPQFILSNYPGLYNPEHQIFAIRTTHCDVYDYPIVFKDNDGHIKKILTDLNGWQGLIESDKYTVEDYKFYHKKMAKLQQNPQKALYINVTKDEIVTKVLPLEMEKKLLFGSVNEDIVGLAGREDWGRWSNDKEVKFRLKSDYFKNTSESPYVVLKFDVRPFIAERHPVLTVEVYANGHSVSLWKFEYGKPMPITNLYIPKDLINEDEADFIFKIDNPKSPVSLGISDDSRALGIGFISLEICEEGDAK